MKIVWLSFAQRDLLSIFAYYQSFASKDVANRIVQRIIHSASNLSDHPYLGRPSDSTAGVHELHVARLPYLLPYRVVRDRIEILRVFHESQDKPSAWQNE